MWVTFFYIKGESLYSFHLCHSQQEVTNLVVLLIDLGESLSDGIDLTYSGYSYTHYQAELGENSESHSGLEDLQKEYRI